MDDEFLVAAWSTPRTALHEQLVQESHTNAGNVAAEWLARSATVAARNRLAALHREVRFQAETITVARLREISERLSDKSNTREADRSMAGDILCAVMLVPELDHTERAEAHRQLIVAATVQQVFKEKPAVDDDGLRERLRLATAVLPADLFSAGGGSARGRASVNRGGVAAASAGGAEPEPREGGDTGSTAEGDFDQRRRQALAELSGLLGRAAPAEVSAARIRVDSDGPLRDPEHRMRATEEAAAAPVALTLTAAALRELSAPAREFVAEVAGGRTNLIEIVELVERAPSPRWAGARAASARSLNPTGGFAPGSGATRPPSQGLVRPPGLGDLLVVRAKHKKYELGAIAHIQNVLAGEELVRTHRRLDRSEEFSSVESSRSESDENEFQSTQRFELATEAQQAANSQSQLQIGLSVTGSYGPVSATASFGYTSSTAHSESARQATTSARETVERAVRKVTEHTTTVRQTRSVHEIEETNAHTLSNDSELHRSGLYRWVDDIRTGAVYSYGPRLMIEAHVPEPGAWLDWAAGTRPELEPPLLPALADGTPLTHAGQLEVNNYLQLAGAQDAVVTPPPAAFSTIGVAMSQEYSQNMPDASTPAFLFYKIDKTLKVPAGYQALRALGTLFASAWKHDCLLALGGSPILDAGSAGATPMVIDTALTRQVGDLPLALNIHSAWGFALALTVVCERTDRALDEWRLATFTAIMAAYAKRRAAYDDARQAASIAAGVGITGRNPAANREIERAELKRAVAGMLAGSALEEFGAIDASAVGEPVIDSAAAVGQGAVVAFYEQAFEWEQLTYLLYPYFWGRHTSWPNGFVRPPDPDPLHEAFRNCGVARVVVPVRPGFERVALHFLSTGRIWNGGNPPQIGDPLYVSLTAEIIAAQRRDQDGTLVAPTWDFTVPTTLVHLQADADLNPAS
ncbi:hypothetical protein AB0B31_14610 [Catellatospora citrea]|uniref:hypothetical protein n=1 Tax=Catellatospora citrea TaxID=53366 RepID=UPI003400348F